MELKLLIVGIVLFALDRLMRRFQPRVQGEKARRFYAWLFGWVSTGWSALVLASLLMYSVVQAFQIPSGSMRGTLLEGDRLFVSKFIYGFHVPLTGGKRVLPMRSVHRGDIIVFRSPEPARTPADLQAGLTKDLVKRCVAVGGDTVEIRNKHLYVNGKLIEESYTRYVDDTVYPRYHVTATPAQYQRTWQEGGFAGLPYEVVRDNFGPVTVPAGHYFGLGDNRDRSFDSRYWGPVPDPNIKGMPLCLYWPPKRISVLH